MKTTFKFALSFVVLLLSAITVFAQGKVTVQLNPNDTLVTVAKKLVITLHVDIENYNGDNSDPSYIYFKAENKDTIFIARNTPIESFQIKVIPKARIVWKGEAVNSDAGKVKMDSYEKVDRTPVELFGKKGFNKVPILGLRKTIKKNVSKGDTEKYNLGFKLKRRGQSPVPYFIDPRITIRVKR